MLKHIKNTKLFLASLIVILGKLVVMSFFSSDYQNLLFFPFVDSFVKKLNNPWDFYFTNNLPNDAFPYPPLMLIILSIFTLPISLFSFDHPLIVNLFFKLPLLISDTVIFYFLLQLFSLKKKRIFIYYFLNPIIFYGIFIHSQLDIIPTMFLVMAIFYLLKNKLLISSILLGLAFLTKTHTIASLPLISLFIFNKQGLKRAFLYGLVVIVTFLIGISPFAFDQGFLTMVFFNQKQSLIFDSFYPIGNVKILLPVISVLLVYFHFFTQKKVNHDLLYFYLGIMFSLLVIFIYPSPAWYVWLVPFIAIYFVQTGNQQKALLFYSFFSLIYLVFFLFFHKGDYQDMIFLTQPINFKVSDNRLINFSFSFLEATLIAIMFSFYKYGVRSNSLYRNQSNLIIGIGGDSGSGKSTLMNCIKLLLKNDLLEIEGDAEHKWERGSHHWEYYTHLNPKANYIYKQADALNDLKNNKVIFRQEYDHENGTFTPPKKIIPKHFIVISGLHPFYLPRMRKIIDLKIYLDTEDQLRKHWKILRDTESRGYSIETILNQIEKRKLDAQRYIYPQKSFADLIIKYFSKTTFDIGNIEAELNLSLQIVFDANVNIEGCIQSLNIEYEWDFNEDLRTQYVTLYHEPTINFEELAKSQIPNFSELFAEEPKFLNGYLGFVQFIISLLISYKLRDLL